MALLIAQDTGLDTRDVNLVLLLLAKHTGTALKEGHRVHLNNLGSLKATVAKVGGTRSALPREGKEGRVPVSSRIVVSFRKAPKLKEVLHGKQRR